MTEHEACPFCGGSAAIDARLIGPWTTGAYTIYFVACFECGARGPYIHVSDCQEACQEANEPEREAIRRAWIAWDRGAKSGGVR